MILELEGHEVRSALTARQALEQVESLKPDVVLLDLGLPELDGYEVARRIQGLPGLHGVRLIARTGYGQAEDGQRTQQAGFADHLIKPVDFTLLPQALAGNR